MNRQILLAEVPEGKLAVAHFRLVESLVPEPEDGQLLLRTRLLSIDAANRAWIQGATYRSALGSGAVMAGLAISEVVKSRATGFAEGDIVFAESGWQEHAVIDSSAATRPPPTPVLSHLLSVFGTSSLTAHAGLLAVGQLKPDETVVVSGAAGSVGTAVGQIAKIVGARVVGIAGGEAKCRWLVDKLGFDAAIDYRGHLSDGLRREVPGGIDLYFDNVGGEILERCLFAMKDHARIVCCGAVSQYDGPKPPHGPRGLPGLLVTKRLTMTGFLVADFPPEAALADLRRWVEQGRFCAVEDIIEGLENAPQALVDQLAGGNRGKRMIKVG